jgi:hypothetical protein
MTTLQRERIEVATPEQPLAPEPRRGTDRVLWFVIAVALLAVVGTVIGLVVLTGGEEPALEPTRAVPTTPQVAATIHPDVLTCQLAAQGLIPSAACDIEAYHTVKAQAQGLIPTVAYDPPLYTREELETIRLVREGKLPAEVLQSEVWTTKRLSNEGLIPEAAVRLGAARRT